MTNNNNLRLYKAAFTVVYRDQFFIMKSTNINNRLRETKNRLFPFSYFDQLEKSYLVQLLTVNDG